MKVKTIKDFDDYDLSACLEHNPQELFSYDDIYGVLAVVEGFNDGEPWHWIIKLKTGEDFYLTGGCDYTGWDCQSWAESILLNQNNSLRKAMVEAGFDSKVDLDVFESLRHQVAEGKNKTWREKKNEEFGLASDS